MTSQIYTEDYTLMNRKRWKAAIRVTAIVLTSFALGYTISEVQLTTPYSGQDVSVNVSDDWHGNVMRSNWGR